MFWQLLGAKTGGACRRFSEEVWVPQACPGPGGSLQWGAWSVSSWDSAWHADQEVSQAEHEGRRVHREAKAATGGLALCWCSELAFLHCTGAEEGSSSLLLAARLSQGSSTFLSAHAGTGSAPARRHPQGCCCERRCQRSCLWHWQEPPAGHTGKLFCSFGNYQMATSLEHARFSLKARRSGPMIILLTKQAVEELWKWEAEGWKQPSVWAPGKGMQDFGSASMWLMQRIHFFSFKIFYEDAFILHYLGNCFDFFFPNSCTISS